MDLLGLQDQREAMIRACNTFGHIKQPPKEGIITSEASNSTSFERLTQGWIKQVTQGFQIIKNFIEHQTNWGKQFDNLCKQKVFHVSYFI